MESSQEEGWCFVHDEDTEEPEPRAPEGETPEPQASVEAASPSSEGRGRPKPRSCVSHEPSTPRRSAPRKYRHGVPKKSPKSRTDASEELFFKDDHFGVPTAASEVALDDFNKEEWDFVAEKEVEDTTEDETEDKTQKTTTKGRKGRKKKAKAKKWF